VICGGPGILDLVKVLEETEWCNWLQIYDHFLIDTPAFFFPWKTHDLGDSKTYIPSDMIDSNYHTFFLTPSSPKAPTVMLVFTHVSWIRAQDGVVHNDSISHRWGKKNKKNNKANRTSQKQASQ